jgi:hypothetical protein
MNYSLARSLEYRVTRLPWYVSVKGPKRVNASPGGGAGVTSQQILSDR